MSKISIYKDDNCTQKLTQEEALSIYSYLDTIAAFDSETLEPIEEVVVQKLDITTIERHKVKHLVYYNQKTNVFSTLMEAIAPMRNIHDDNGNYLYTMPMFWMKLDNENTIQDLNNPSISWARRSMRAFNAEEINTIKSTKTLEECIFSMVEKMRKNAQSENLVINWGGFIKLSPDEIANLGNRTDTIISYSRETFEEEITINTHNFKAEDIKQFSFIHEWYWDYKRHKLSVCTLYFAPIELRPLSSKENLYLIHLFYKSLH